jgi:hypothetical protein
MMLAALLASASLLLAEPSLHTPTVKVDLTALAADMTNRPWLATLYRGLLVRIVEEGMAVVGSGSTADISLRLLPSEVPRVHVRVDYGCRQREAELSLAGLAEDAVVLSLLHRSIELLRVAREALAGGDVACAEAQAAAPTAQTETPRPLEAERTARRRFDVSAGVQGTWSPGQHGLVYDLSADFGPRDGWGWVGDVLFYHPLGADARLHIVEWSCQAGVRHRWTIGPSRYRWDNQAMFGYWQHRYAFAEPGGTSDQGTRNDAALTLRTGVLASIAAGGEVGLYAGAIALSEARVHRDGTRTLWKATLVRATMGLSLSYGL